MAKRTVYADLPKGIYYIKRTGKYQARLKGKFLGTFESPERAKKILAAAKRVESRERSTRAVFTLRKWGEVWLDDRETCGEYRRVRADRNTWARFVETWKCVDWPIRKIQPRDVRAFVAELERTDAVKTAIYRKQGNREGNPFTGPQTQSLSNSESAESPPQVSGRRRRRRKDRQQPRMGHQGREEAFGQFESRTHRVFSSGGSSETTGM